MKKNVMTAGLAACVLAALAMVPVAVADDGPPKVWKKCTTCHHFTDHAYIGPGLRAVIGRTAGTRAGFKYKFTKYIVGDAWTWDEAHLRKWMCNSKKAVKEFTGNPKARTRMPKMKICDAAKQDEVLAKLKE